MSSQRVLPLEAVAHSCWPEPTHAAAGSTNESSLRLLVWGLAGGSVGDASRGEHSSGSPQSFAAAEAEKEKRGRTAEPISKSPRATYVSQSFLLSFLRSATLGFALGSSPSDGCVRGPGMSCVPSQLMQ
eukprot:1920858-Rhodomonas_salina.3